MKKKNQSRIKEQREMRSAILDPVVNKNLLEEKNYEQKPE